MDFEGAITRAICLHTYLSIRSCKMLMGERRRRLERRRTNVTVILEGFCDGWMDDCEVVVRPLRLFV